MQFVHAVQNLQMLICGGEKFSNLNNFYNACHARVSKE